RRWALGLKSPTSTRKLC
uniref:Uncharacterized protein n=1 Tax=Amphimedon queenslandica TaxID=400682 RepID=A0A1X7U8Z1_AMPQE